jgi:hypothetical protein
LHIEHGGGGGQEGVKITNLNPPADFLVFGGTGA